jgi:hypothetical protein
MSNRTELHNKIQQLTAKIIDLNTGFAQKSTLNTLDLDLLRKYTVDLYDAVLELNSTDKAASVAEFITPVVTTVPVPVPPPAPVKEPVTTPYVEPAPPKIDAPMPKVEQPVPPPPAFEIPVKPVVVEVPVVEPPKVQEPVAPIAPPVVVETPIAPVVPVAPVTPPPAPVAQPVNKVVNEPSLNDRLHTGPEGNDLVSKLQQTPIHDLKKAISINKKFEFINQLFKGDHEAYAKSIHYINGLTSGTEADTFFRNLKREFSWEEENTLFLELADMVRRRFM